MSDVRIDGSEVFGKGVAILRGRASWLNQDRVSDFLKIMDTQFSEVEKAAWYYCDMATNSNITLPHDDPFELMVKPDGSWELVILDLRFGLYDEQSSSTQIKDNNKRHVEVFLKHLETIKKYLQK